ncbi:MAG TPA: hypothetical protein VEU96_14530 [Bryobacteraceae bacterium]|nr:hypothetical protein [Bryobacteraceae bacterium]
MSGIPAAQLVFLVIQTAALIGLSVRIWWSGLYRLYPFFFGYLLATLLQTAVLTLTPYDRTHYPYAWIPTEGIILCFYSLIVLECYTIALRGLPGIASLSRRYIKAGLAVAIVVSLLLLGLEKAPNGRNITLTFIVFERVIVTSLVIFVLLILGFLAYYPVSLSRNVVVYSIGYAVYFLDKATLLLLVNRTHHGSQLASTVLIVVSTLCLVFWLFALNKGGETKTVVVGHRWKPGEEARLLSQLQVINDHLIRTARKGS